MAFPRLMRSLEELEGGLGGVASRLSEQAAEIRGAVADIEKNVKRAETAVSESFSRAREQARQGRDEIGSLVDELLAKSSDQLAELEGLLGDNPFADELKKQFDLLEIGGTTIQEIIRLFGEAKVGAETVRELLQGIDAEGFARDLQEVIKGLGKGTVELGDLIKLMNERGGDFGKTLSSWFEAFEKGKLTVQQLKDLLENFADQFDFGQDLEALLDEIGKAVDSGALS